MSKSLQCARCGRRPGDPDYCAACASYRMGDPVLGAAKPIDSACEETEPTDHPVEHPAHYTQHPSGVECIQVTEHLNFCVGNAIKYLWRVGLKGDAIEDLKKARWYVDREIARLEAAGEGAR